MYGDREESLVLRKWPHSICGPWTHRARLIEAMIDRLTKEAAQEADAKAFCDTENSKSKAKQADLMAKLDKHAVRIEKATAGIDELKVPRRRRRRSPFAADVRGCHHRDRCARGGKVSTLFSLLCLHVSTQAS